MKFIKLLIGLTITTAALTAQSFYVLTGVKAYDPIVANMSTQIDKKYNAQIKEMLKSASKELGVNIEGHPSTILGFIFTDFSVGDTKAVRVELSLGEYVSREGRTDKIFAVTYTDIRQFAPEADEEEFEEQLIDLTEEMMDKFVLQHKEDNKKISESTNIVNHEGFATQMKYETNYDASVKKAKAAGKPIMLFMTTNFCPWCRKLESRILAKDDINSKVHEKYVPLMLNLDTDTFPVHLSKNRFTPILYIINPDDGKVINQFTGYSNRDGFLQLLKK